MKTVKEFIDGDMIVESLNTSGGMSDLIKALRKELISGKQITLIAKANSNTKVSWNISKDI